MKTLGKNDLGRAKEIDAKVKNRFRYEWLETTVNLKSKKLSEIEVTLGGSIEKLDLPGKALCSFCNDVISYGGKGKIALVDHVQSAKHIARVEHRRTNYTLGGQYSKNTQETPLFPLFKPLKKLSDSNNPACSSSLQTTSTSSASSSSEDQLRLIPLNDRTANLEAMILSMMAENNISFSVAPRLVELIRECCNDPKALAGVALDRCVAAYKLKYGVSDFFTTGIIECMKTCLFSLNIDEATSSSNKKVLAVLVNYYSPVKQQVVIEHLASVELVKTDASTIFNAIKDLMDSNSIPWKNLQSCLLDSCNVMRGAKTGVEARLKEQAPHLLDINGEEERKKDLDQQVHVLTTIAKAKSIKQHAIKKAFKRHQSALGGGLRREGNTNWGIKQPPTLLLDACMPTQCYEHCK
ncbi:hypothetical protein PoB_001491100 [Plakobranchus ocellatus]|uniref:Uncharacterized protein n=1 Tax=Plakobranchus ocellatus TaxID=259542 RepID=A0AAV3Z1F8_9GAST|nr:hypothetical protein PoB_001491100 [Plakobranchus ocellatus]